CVEAAGSRRSRGPAGSRSHARGPAARRCAVAAGWPGRAASPQGGRRSTDLVSRCSVTCQRLLTCINVAWHASATSSLRKCYGLRAYPIDVGRLVRNSASSALNCPTTTRVGQVMSFRRSTAGHTSSRSGERGVPVDLRASLDERAAETDVEAGQVELVEAVAVTVR